MTLLITGENFSLHRQESVSFTEESLTFLQEKLQDDAKPQNLIAKIGRIASFILLPVGITGLILGFGSASAVATAFSIIGSILIVLSTAYLAISLLSVDKAFIADLIGEPHYNAIKDRPNNQSQPANIIFHGDNSDWEYIRRCLTVLFPQYDQAKKDLEERAKQIAAEKAAEKYDQDMVNTSKEGLVDLTNTNAPFSSVIMDYMMDPDHPLENHQNALLLSAIITSEGRS